MGGHVKLGAVRNMLDWIVDTKQVFQRFSHLCKVSWCELGGRRREEAVAVSQLSSAGDDWN